VVYDSPRIILKNEAIWHELETVGTNFKLHTWCLAAFRNMDLEGILQAKANIVLLLMARAMDI
jgi:hypothetical protein